MDWRFSKFATETHIMWYFQMYFSKWWWQPWINPLADMRLVIPMSEFICCCWLEKLKLICLSRFKTIFSAFHIRGRWKGPLSGGKVSENWWQKWYEDRKGEVSKQKVTVKSWASSCVFTQLCLQSPLLFYWLQNSRKENSRSQPALLHQSVTEQYKEEPF